MNMPDERVTFSSLPPTHFMCVKTNLFISTYKMKLASYCMFFYSKPSSAVDEIVTFPLRQRSSCPFIEKSESYTSCTTLLGIILLQQNQPRHIIIYFSLLSMPQRHNNNNNTHSNNCPTLSITS